MRDASESNEKSVRGSVMAQKISERPCYSCGKPLGESTFTFTSKGGVHFNCFSRDAKAGKPATLSDEGLNALIDSLSEKLNGIVSFKQRMSKLADEEAAKLLQQIERDEEKHAAELTKFIERITAK